MDKDDVSLYASLGAVVLSVIAVLAAIALPGPAGTPGQPGEPGPQGPPGEVLVIPSWPPLPCEPDCAWHEVREFSAGGGGQDTVNITGTMLRINWSATSGCSTCTFTLSVTFTKRPSEPAGTIYLLNNRKFVGTITDEYNIPTDLIPGGLGPGDYSVVVAWSPTAGWPWRVTLQEWR